MPVNRILPAIFMIDNGFRYAAIVWNICESYFHVMNMDGFYVNNCNCPLRGKDHQFICCASITGNLLKTIMNDKVVHNNDKKRSKRIGEIIDGIRR